MAMLLRFLSVLVLLGPLAASAGVIGVPSVLQVAKLGSDVRPFFGRSHWVRGGSSSGPVLDPTTLMGFNAALSSAGPDTLVVIDFSATW